MEAREIPNQQAPAAGRRKKREREREKGRAGSPASGATPHTRQHFSKRNEANRGAEEDIEHVSTGEWHICLFLLLSPSLSSFLQAQLELGEECAGRGRQYRNRDREKQLLPVSKTKLVPTHDIKSCCLLCV